MKFSRCIGIVLTILCLSGLTQWQVPKVWAALTNFSFSDFTSGSSKVAGLPFEVTITALDENNATMTSYTLSASLSDLTGTMYPIATGNFVNGVWTGDVYITRSGTSNAITVSSGAVNKASNTFTVLPDSRIKFLSIVSGNNQSQIVGSQLSNALTLKAVDPFNNALSNVGVNFAITSVPPSATNHSITSSSGTTNSSGTTSTTMTLGRKAGTYIVAASLTSGITNTINFYETAIPASLISLNISPALAVIPAGSYIPFTATGYDQYLNPIALSSVTWSVQNGGGTIDSTGVFYAGTTLGSFMNTIKAVQGSIGSTASVTISDSQVAGGEAGNGEGEGSGSGSGSGSGESSGSGQIVPTTEPFSIKEIGVLNTVFVDPSVITALKGQTIPITASAFDSTGRGVANVNFTFEVSGTLGTITQSSSDTVLLTVSESGIGTVTVTATQGDIVKVAKVVGSVGTGLNRRLVIEEIQSPQTAGEPFTISIAAKDSLNNFLTDYTGPLVLADSTGTIDPSVVQPNNQGIWYVQAIISLAYPEVSITAAGDGMVGVSNIFEVVGDPKKGPLSLGAGAGDGEGFGDVLGASISGKIDELLKSKNLNKFTIVRYIGGGIAAGFGILGSSIGGGIMVSRGLEAIGRNPYAKGKLQVNLYVSLMAFIAAASLAVVAAFLIIR